MEKIGKSGPFVQFRPFLFLFNTADLFFFSTPDLNGSLESSCTQNKSQRFTQVQLTFALFIFVKIDAKIPLFSAIKIVSLKFENMTKPLIFKEKSKKFCQIFDLGTFFYYVIQICNLTNVTNCCISLKDARSICYPVSKTPSKRLSDLLVKRYSTA